MHITANGIRFNIQIDGREDAPWLMFSNSHCTTLDLWDEMVERFKDRFHILRYDTRGHGGTDAPQGDYTQDQLAGDVAAILDELKIDRVHFCGISIGGQTGLGLAIHHPRRLLTLTAANARFDVPKPVMKAWDERIAVVEKGGTEAIAGPTVSRWFEANYPAQNPQRVARIQAMFKNVSKQGYIGCAIAIRDLNYRDALAKINLPVLLISGKQDSSATEDMVNTMLGMIRGATLEMLSPAGHLTVVEQPEAFGNALEKFLSAH
ncbi:MAG: alpha/beta fold hydrolase [Burkholderiales bacterium]